ncbi:hypothetical protein IY230_01825, partial [Acholeplasma laidlawii]|uniref:hypothetical protein n=1 Tax=Acholeplasma laidlawii TaxID=2148 RepID=UPI0018C27B81
FSGTIDILGIVDTLLLDQTSGGISKAGVRHIYGSRIIDNLLTRVIEHERTHQMVADVINHYLGEVETRLDVSLSRVVASELEISKALVDEAATVHLLEAIQSLGVSEINELTSIRTLSEVADLLDLRASDEKAMKLFSTPVLEHALKIGLSHN